MISAEMIEALYELKDIEWEASRKASESREEWLAMVEKATDHESACCPQMSMALKPVYREDEKTSYPALNFIFAPNGGSLVLANDEHLSPVNFCPWCGKTIWEFA